jgi:mutator protein MutT
VNNLMTQTIEQRHVVGVILYNSDDEVLLQQRDDKPGLPYAGQWTFFGGAVEVGETPAQAIVRELHEELELGLSVRFWQRYVCPARTIPNKVVTYNTLFLGQLEREQTPTALHEGQAMRWFNAEAAQHLALAFLQSPYLREFFAERPQLLVSTQERADS